MEQIIFHMMGDYLLQNHWMANEKTKHTPLGYLACLMHCLIYSLPFLLIGSFKAFLVIFLTHFLIDKFRLAKYWTMFYNGSKENNGYGTSTPVYLSTWLLFINDNVIHIIINYLSLKFL